MKAGVLAAKQSSSSKFNFDSVSFMEESISGYKAPTVNWYPGHIAKAERTLAETLNSADLLLEVRDARIPAATAHPRVREWAAGKPRIVVLTRVDMVPNVAVKSWVQAMNLFGGGRWDGNIQDGNLKHRERQAMKERGASDHIENEVESVLFVDAKRGQGMPALMRAISKAGAYVNERRNNRGLRERPLRVAVLGYPNVGKSSLINRYVNLLFYFL
jgi:ribosome biogenesis GTPase A